MHAARFTIALLLVLVLQTACARDGRVFALMRRGGGGSAVLMADGMGTHALTRETTDTPVDMSLNGEWIALCFLDADGTSVVETYRSDAHLFTRHRQWKSPVAIACIAAESDGNVTGVSRDGTRVVKFEENFVSSACLLRPVSPHDCMRGDDGFLLVAQQRGSMVHIAVIDDADPVGAGGAWYFARRVTASPSHWTIRVGDQKRLIGTERKRDGLSMTTYSKPTETFVRYGATSVRLESWYPALPWVVVMP